MDWKRLGSFHLRCQRRILGIKWSDFVTHADVYARSGIQNIESIVCRHRLSLFGHGARMSDDIPARAVLRMASDIRDGIPPFASWRRPWGRPPMLHQIRSDCGLSARAEMPSAVLRTGSCLHTKISCWPVQWCEII